MEIIEINKLKPHPRNNEFFDDIQGDNWEEFKKSIETSGVIEPIVISNTSVIVSGHQRVRACIELGIKEVPCRIKMYDTDNAEDVILKELLETNLRQRGIGNLNPIKFARCIVELERIYNISHGNNQHRTEDNLQSKKKKELASELGMSQQHVNAYKKLLNLIPELQELIETGQMTSTVGHKVWATISTEEQKKLVEELGADKIIEMTQKQTEQYINKIKELENKPPKIIDKTDYTTIDTLKMQIRHKEKDIESLQRDKSLLEKKCKLNEADAENYKKMKSEIEFLTKQKNDIARQIESATELSGLTVEIKNILFNKLSPVKYSRSFERLNSSVAMDNFISLVDTVRSWCDEIDGLIGRKNNNIVEVIDYEQ